MSRSKLLCGYWLGYQPEGNALGDTPDYFNKVTLFVAGPATDGKSLDVSYLCKAYSQDQQIEWVRRLQSQGAEVLMSLMDTPSTHWNDVDIPAFVRNVKDVAIDGKWGLNGVDIDLESGMPSGVWSQIFIQLIQEFRKVLGPKNTTDSNGKCASRISVAAYRPNMERSILQAAGVDLDWLNTMAYGNDAAGNESLYRDYSKTVDQINLGIGVYYQAGQSTDLEQVRETAVFAGRTSDCGMMEFGLNNDCERYSGHPKWTWASTIDANLP